MVTAISKEFIEQSIHRIEESTKKVIKCLDEINDEEIYHQIIILIVLAI